MTKKSRLLLLLAGLMVVLSAGTVAGNLENGIRAAQSDLKVFCPAAKTEDIQWTALLYLNQVYGAEIYIGLIQPSPLFECQVASTSDGQFHLARIGRGQNMDDSTLADYIAGRLFNGVYPHLAIFAADNPQDSLYLLTLLTRMKWFSEADSQALAPLEKIYILGTGQASAAVVLEDEEMYRTYSDRANEIDKTLGPLTYRPERLRYYYLMTSAGDGKKTGNFVGESDRFRLPQLLAGRLFEGPEKKSILERLESFKSALWRAQQSVLGKAEKTKLLCAAYQEISRVAETVDAGLGQTVGTRITLWVQQIQQKAFWALNEALDLDWRGRMEIRKTPNDRIAKLTVDLNLNGAQPVQLSHLKLREPSKVPVVIDSILETVLPHQRFCREYLLDANTFNLGAAAADSFQLLFGMTVEGVSLELPVPLVGYAHENLSISFLPGYTFLPPFTENQLTALVQQFDWQMVITKPYGEAFDGQLNIITPDGVVVGTYEKRISMPSEMTRKYLNVYLAAGRSMGYDLKTVKATLVADDKVLANAEADVRVIRCEIPDTRHIAFVPDREGRLEDFLRLSKSSFQPLTPYGVVRANLDAYGVIIIGPGATEYYDLLRANGDRLKQYLVNGGEVLILGQTFGWPNGIFESPILADELVGFQPAEVTKPNHSILNSPYKINIDFINDMLKDVGHANPAIINGGTEIVSADKLGSYLRVIKVGDGHIIYCGLPILEMAAKLNVDAVHFLANLIDFGHGQ